jgi:hypothetical protein
VIKQDALQNELAVLLGLRVQSRYVLTDGVVIWIATDAWVFRPNVNADFTGSIWPH